MNAERSNASLPSSFDFHPSALLPPALTLTLSPEYGGEGEIGIALSPPTAGAVGYCLPPLRG